MGREDLISLINELNTLCVDLHKDYKINYGGCCFVAYILMKNFELIGIQTELVIEDNDDVCDENDVYNNVKERSQYCNGLGCDTCSHYFIYVPEVNLWVNAGDCCVDDMRYVSDLNSKDLHWIYKTGSWNTTFSKRHRPMIGRKIKGVFREYEGLCEKRDSCRCS